jgi:hypothetical protein
MYMIFGYLLEDSLVNIYNRVHLIYWPYFVPILVPQKGMIR